MKLRNLDILRACLALMVLVGHARMMLWMPWHEWNLLPHDILSKAIAITFIPFRYGHQAVMVFFALSGFFIHLRAALQRAKQQPFRFHAGEYLQRRAWRILPPYYMVLLFTVMLDLMGHHWFPMLYLAETGDTMIDANFKNAGYQMTSVLPALLAQPSLLGIHFGSNGPLWSIGNEVFYYILYPLFMLVWTKQRSLAYTLGISVGMLCWFMPLTGWWTGALGHYPVWLSGALMAELLSMRSSSVSNHRAWWLISSLVALMAFTSTHLAIAQTSSPIMILLYMAMGAATIGAFEMLPFDLLKTRLGSLLEWLGIRSYSLYIFHFPVLVLISAWCFQIHGARPAHGWLAILGVVSSLSAGLLGFRLIERHFLPVRQAA